MNGAIIKDVAKLAGVSTATVSRVINKNYHVTPKTTNKVLKAIRFLNYYPNAIARSLKKLKTDTIGFIVSDISNYHFMHVARAIEDVVSLNGFNIIVCSTDGRKDRELEYLRTFISKRIDALILNATGKNDETICELSHKMPIILMHRRVKGKYNFEGDFIDSNNVSGIYKLTNHLTSNGHRKIAILNGPQDMSTAKERFVGFRKAMSEVGICVDRNYPYKFNGDFTYESGYMGAKEILGKEDKPTAFIGMNNATALGALKYKKKKIINIPEDVSFVSFGDLDNCDLFYFQPTFVTTDAHEIGTKAGELLLERMRDSKPGNREIVLEPALIVGNSVRNIKSEKSIDKK